MKISINEELCKIPYWSISKCVFCGRGYPQVLLNVEGRLHHDLPMQCLDKKKCNRKVRKIKKGE